MQSLTLANDVVASRRKKTQFYTHESGEFSFVLEYWQHYMQCMSYHTTRDAWTQLTDQSRFWETSALLSHRRENASPSGRSRTSSLLKSFLRNEVLRIKFFQKFWYTTWAFFVKKKCSVPVSANKHKVLIIWYWPRCLHYTHSLNNADVLRNAVNDVTLARVI